MYSDYYSLNHGRQAVDFIYEANLGFSYGNCFKYCVRANRKPDSTAESDLNKALTYMESAKKEYCFLKRLFLRFFNSFTVEHIQFSSKDLSDILNAIVKFDSPERISRLIVKYMASRNIPIKKEFEKYCK